MGLRWRDQAGGVSAALIIGIIFGTIVALAMVWFLVGERVGGMGAG